MNRLSYEPSRMLFRTLGPRLTSIARCACVMLHGGFPLSAPLQILDAGSESAALASETNRCEGLTSAVFLESHYFYEHQKSYT